MSAAVGERAISVRLGEDATAVAAARRALGGLGGELDAELLEDMRLLVSKLVTNVVDRLADRWGVVRRGGTRVWVEIDRPRPAS